MLAADLATLPCACDFPKIGAQLGKDPLKRGALNIKERLPHQFICRCLRCIPGLLKGLNCSLQLCWLGAVVGKMIGLRHSPPASESRFRNFERAMHRAVGC